MKSLYIRCSLVMVLLVGCRSKTHEQLTAALIKHDVPIFLRVLPFLPHDNIEVAFEHLKSALNYTEHIPPVNEGTYEASSSPKPSRVQFILLMVPNEGQSTYSVNLFLYGAPLKDAPGENLLLQELVQDLGPYATDSTPSWDINGWQLQLRNTHSIVYAPYLELWDMIEDQTP